MVWRRAARASSRQILYLENWFQLQRVKNGQIECIGDVDEDWRAEYPHDELRSEFVSFRRESEQSNSRNMAVNHRDEEELEGSPSNISSAKRKNVSQHTNPFLIILGIFLWNITVQYLRAPVILNTYF